ncbi:MAG: DUF2203 domain-containing protein [Actinomycetota bacterium]
MTTYTVAEANELLPYLAPVLVELREKYELAMQIQERLEGAAVTNGGSKHRERWQKTLTRVQELMDRMNDWNIEVRDLGSGLVDFPSRRGDSDVWLCWRMGEPEVAYWHGRDEGFSSRRAL